MKVLFLNPPSLSAQNVVRDSIYGCWCKGKRIGGAMTPPYPLLLLATVLRAAGHQAEIIDALAEDLSFDEVVGRCAGVDFVVLLTSVMTFSEDRVVLGELKRRQPHLKTIIYGSIATFMPEFCLRFEEVDFIIRREAEWALRDFLTDYAAGGERWKQARGLGYREGGRPVVNDFYPFIENLDDLPFADWSLLKASRRYFNPAVARHPYVTDLTSRGCPGRCIYCMAPPFYGRKIRARSTQNVLEGFRRHAAAGYREVYIRDEMFTTFRGRVREICQGIIAEGLDLTWLCSAKVGSIDREAMDLMKRAGCHTIKLGVESGCQEILDRVKKDIKVEQTAETFRWAREVGLNTHAHMMIGAPGETADTIRRTLKFLKKIKPTTVTFAIITPFPGTPLFEEVAAKDPKLKDACNLELADLHSKSFHTDAFCELSPEELAFWLKKAHRSFYLRPAYILEWLSRVRSPGDLLKLVRAGSKVIDFSLRGE